MNRIAIIGASARAAAMSAARAGLEVVAADLFADIDLKAIAQTTQIKEYPQGFADWLAKQQVDFWIYTGALENYPQLVGQLANSASLLGVSGELLPLVRDPWWLAKQCQENDIPYPPTVACNNVLEQQRQTDDKQWLAKTYQHSSGCGTWLLKEPSDWQRARDAQAVAQLLIKGTNRSAIFAITNRDAHFYGLTEQLVGSVASKTILHTNARPWQYVGSLATEESASLQNRLNNIGSWLYAIGLRGIVGVDFIDDGKQLWLLEINPRYTASIEVIERSKRNSVFQLLLSQTNQRDKSKAELLANAPFDEEAFNQLWGKVILYAKENLTITARFQDWAMRQAAEGLAADLPHEKSFIEQGEPVLTLFASKAKGQKSNEPLIEKLATKLMEAEQHLFC